MRVALEGGVVVFADVGPNVGSLTTVRIFELIGAGEPTNADILRMDELENQARRRMCPEWGAAPRNAIWAVTVYGTRALGA